MFLYIDSLFGEGRRPEAKPLHTLPSTLNELYLQAMREHDRRAVQCYKDGAVWAEMPDWRFDRRVIRTALFLRERLGVEPGDRVAILSELRPEWLLADFAVTALGAVSVAIPAELPPEAVARALADADPRAAFLSRALVRAAGGALADRPVIVFDGSGDSDDFIDFSDLLDFGGTLDTPEHAQRFRAGARQVAASAAAIRHYEPGQDGAAPFSELTQAETVERLRGGWIERPAWKGDRVYVTGPLTLTTRLALYAAIGDGYSTLVLGSSGREREEIAELTPETVVAPAEVLERLLAGHQDEERHGRRGLARLAARLAGQGRGRRTGEAVRAALGGRVRSVVSTTPPSPELSARLAGVAVGAGGGEAEPACGPRDGCRDLL